jgi:molybdenum cofactor synthesis domain-containing protein
MRVGILTVSDAGHRGEREDTSGDAIQAWSLARGATVASRSLVPDETSHICATLSAWADGGEVDLILTTGGTGLTARDVTPEATKAILEREAPGISEALRVSVLATFPRAALSRGVAGIRGKTLIVNLPGSTGGVKDGLKVLEQWIDHAIDLVRGEKTDHGPTVRRSDGPTVRRSDGPTV